MELRHLKMIQEVARTKSLTKAAENLYLSQSALSHQLKEIEDYFQTQLFIRQKKQMLLTKEGEVVLLSSQRIMDEIENTTKQIRMMTEKDCGEIRLSTECYTSYPWLSGFLKEFQSLYPRVDIHIKAEATRHALANVLENKIDVGIFEDNRNKNLIYTPLFSDEFYAIVPPGHPWTKRKCVEIESFQQESYIMYNIPLEESNIYGLIFQRGKPVKLYQVMLTEAILEMVKAGLGVTIQPEWVAARYLQSKELEAVKITRKGFKRTWYAGVLKNKVIPSYMLSFINHLAKHMKQSEESKKQVCFA
jgi:LysR family transcriptional regulator for metE and metH